jgi:hypothetical protein
MEGSQSHRTISTSKPLEESKKQEGIDYKPMGEAFPRE